MSAPPAQRPAERANASEGNADRDGDGIADARDHCPDGEPRGNGAGCAAIVVARDGPNIAILLNLAPKSVALEQGKEFALWGGLADAILKADMCAVAQTFALDDDQTARALGDRRAAAAEQFLLRRGFSKERILVEPNADPSGLLQQGMNAERLRDGVLLTPHDVCPVSEHRASAPSPPATEATRESRWAGGSVAPDSPGSAVTMPRPTSHWPNSCAFPREAARDVRDATVMLEVLVQADGRVGEARVLSESSPGFGVTAQLCALQNGAFEPARDARGTPVPKAVKLRIRFSR